MKVTDPRFALVSYVVRVGVEIRGGCARSRVWRNEPGGGQESESDKRRQRKRDRDVPRGEEGQGVIPFL